MKLSIVPALLASRNTVSEDPRCPTNLAREQHEPATRLAGSFPVASESLCNDLRVTSVTVPQRHLTVERLQAQNDQLLEEVGRLTSEQGSSETLRDERKVSRIPLADHDAETNRTLVGHISIFKSLDNGLLGLGDQS